LEQPRLQTLIQHTLYTILYVAAHLPLSIV